MSLASAYIWESTSGPRGRSRVDTKHAKEYVRWSMNRWWVPTPFQLHQKCRGRWKKWGAGTHIDISFDVSNEDEVARPSVADVGVYGDGAPRVALDGVGRLRGGVAGSRAVSKASGTVGETGRGGEWPKHFVRLHASRK